MKWMKTVAAMLVTVALALGASGCSQKNTQADKPKPLTPSGNPQGSVADKMKEAAPAAK